MIRKEKKIFLEKFSQNTGGYFCAGGWLFSVILMSLTFIHCRNFQSIFNAAAAVENHFLKCVLHKHMMIIIIKIMDIDEFSRIGLRKKKN